MSKTKKRLLITIPLILAAAVAIFSLWWFVLRDDWGDATVSVEKVSVITGTSGGLQNRFAGVVEPQATLDVTLDSSRTLAETFVLVGDEVDEGTPLFSYDTEELKLQIEQLKLDIDRVDNTITTLESQISALKKERDKLTNDSLKLEYTQQIQSYEAQIKQEEYNIKNKKLDLSSLESKVENSIVYAEMAGIIQSITNPDSGNMGGGYYYDPGMQSNAYITILALGDFRIKGLINEQNIWDLEPGTQVLIRSRLDNSVTWLGSVDYVDMENPSSSSNDQYYYYMPSDPMVSSSKYPFYIVLEDSEGLMLGQHVYIEPYIEVEDEGLWLREYYILTDDDGTAWVWAANQETEKIEKRVITIGGYDAAIQSFEITDGLSLSDEIAWPTDEIRAGMPITREGFVDFGFGDGEMGFDAPVFEGEQGFMPDGLLPDDDGILPEGEQEGELEGERPPLSGEESPDVPVITSYVSGSDVPSYTLPSTDSSLGR